MYNKRKLIHDHEVGSSHIDLSHLSKSPGAEVRMVLMGKGNQQGEISFLPELRHSGATAGTAAHHAAPAVAAGGLAAGGAGAAGGYWSLGWLFSLGNFSSDTSKLYVLPCTLLCTK